MRLSELKNHKTTLKLYKITYKVGEFEVKTKEIYSNNISESIKDFTQLTSKSESQIITITII